MVALWEDCVRDHGPVAHVTLWEDGTATGWPGGLEDYQELKVRGRLLMAAA